MFKKTKIAAVSAAVLGLSSMAAQAAGLIGSPVTTKFHARFNTLIGQTLESQV